VEPGLSLSWLVPNPWDNLIDLTFEITNGQNEVSFDGGDSDDFLYSLHLKNFFDLTPNATLELGLSGVTGVNDPAGKQRSFVEGIDLTYRWKPVRYNRYRSFTVQSEFLFSQREQAAGSNVNSFGFFTFLQYQLTQRLFLSARFDYAEFPDSGDLNQKAISGILTFWPSEFETLSDWEDISVSPEPKCFFIAETVFSSSATFSLSFFISSFDFWLSCWPKTKL